MVSIVRGGRELTDKILLIDGHSIMSRAFYGIPELTNSQGLHTNAVYGFLNILLKVLDQEQADHLAVAFDVHEPTFRHKMFADYKGTRKPMPPELPEQEVLSVSLALVPPGSGGAFGKDAFGNRTVEEETVENRFGFAGEMMDAVTGQYYLRARFYNPVIARFLSEDTYYGDGLNLYAYRFSPSP